MESNDNVDGCTLIGGVASTRNVTSDTKANGSEQERLI